MDIDEFRDRSHRYSYLVACETARRLQEDPGLIEIGRQHLEKFQAGKAEYRAGCELWLGLLNAGVPTIVSALTARSHAGDYARETAPSFGGLPARVRTRLLAQAAMPVAVNAT